MENLVGVKSEKRFENFVIGNSNRFATAAAKAVAAKPGKAYSPLYIRADPGSGKTHLLHAIGNKIAEADIKAHIRYMSATNLAFAADRAMKDNRLTEYLDEFARWDCILLDDADILIELPEMHDVFCRLVELAKEYKIQLVFASRLNLRNFEECMDKIRGITKKGLTADIEFPDRKLRMDILRIHAEERGVPVKKDAFRLTAIIFKKYSIGDMLKEFDRMVDEALEHARPVIMVVPVDVLEE